MMIANAEHNYTRSVSLHATSGKFILFLQLLKMVLLNTINEKKLSRVLYISTFNSKSIARGNAFPLFYLISAFAGFKCRGVGCVGYRCIVYPFF